MIVVRALLCLILWIVMVVPSGAAMTDPNFEETIYINKSKALANAFPDATEIDQDQIMVSALQRTQIEFDLGWKIENDAFPYYIAKSEDVILGYAFITEEIGKHYPITFLVSMSAELVIEHVEIMVYREQIGAEVRSRRFLKQFFGKTRHDTIAIDRDIDGISGATLSSWAVASGVKRVLVMANALLEGQQTALR
jgi:Na+-translocating ferredoxin:NAD+ oxidoreductase RnfG subunit